MSSASLSRLSLAAGLALLFAASGRAASDPQTFLPDDCHLIVVMRVKDQINSPAYKALLALGKDFGGAAGQSEDQIKDNMGLDPNNVVMITGGMNIGKLDELAQQFQGGPNSVPPMIMVAQVSKPTKAAEIKAAIKGKEFSEVKVGAFTMLESKDMAFCVADDQTVVYGPPGQLKAVLQRNKAPKLSESMDKAMRELANPKSTAMALALKDLVARPEIQQPLQGANPQVQMFVNELEGVVLQIGMAENIDVALSVLMKTNKSADDLRKMADGFLAIAKLGAGQEVPREALEIVNSIKLATDGSKLQGSMAIKTDTLTKLAKDAAKKAGLPQ